MYQQWKTWSFSKANYRLQVKFNSKYQWFNHSIIMTNVKSENVNRTFHPKYILFPVIKIVYIWESVHFIRESRQPWKIQLNMNFGLINHLVARIRNVRSNKHLRKRVAKKRQPDQQNSEKTTHLSPITYKLKAMNLHRSLSAVSMKFFCAFLVFFSTFEMANMAAFPVDFA